MLAKTLPYQDLLAKIFKLFKGLWCLSPRRNSYDHNDKQHDNICIIAYIYRPLHNHLYYRPFVNHLYYRPPIVAARYSFRNASHEERLLAYLFQDYDPVARSVMDINEPVKVTVDFVLLRIHGLVSGLASAGFDCIITVPRENTGDNRAICHHHNLFNWQVPLKVASQARHLHYCGLGGLIHLWKLGLQMYMLVKPK